MKNIFEYEDKDGIFHKADPLVKIIFLLIFWTVCFYANLWQLAIIVIFISVMAICFGLRKRFFQQARFFLIFVFPFILVFHLFFYQSFSAQNPSLFFFNPSLSIEGFKMGLQISFRLFCLLSSSILFIATTSPLRQAKRLSGIKILGHKIPKSIVFLSIFINRSIALIFNDLEQILDAQKARGFSLREAKIKDKVAGYTGLLIPLLTISLERAQKQAIALELKGFKSK
ncbi:energy-coupling factor transporter transmembrane protein EcfT [Candidatus Parcubacteria bacterium]|nr:energy-coupling factor transporter transmembrane protein EcfT [Candidatus Parcubacteria bacterium]